MSVLPVQTIRKLCEQERLIDPWCLRTVRHGVSFGLGPCGYDIRIAEEHWLYPNDFVLGSSLERFRIPTHLMAVVHDKSTWARRGVCLQNTVLEPGWQGYLTLEITNHGRERIRIEQGHPIAQVVFHRLEAITEMPYEGKYQDAPAGPQEAILEK